MTTANAQEEPLYRHIAALRQCLIRSITAVLLLLCVTSFFSKELYALLAMPLQKTLPAGSHFITTHPIEAWYTYFRTALYSAVFLATPIIFHQIWSFIAPGLAKTERRTFFGIILSSSALFILGGLFGYFIAFPIGFGYFSSILDGTGILFLPRMEDYLTFAFQMLIAFGIITETPLFMVLLAYLGLVTSKTLSAFRRYYIVIAFIIAAILTPPDVVSQMMMGIPMLMLYEVGVVGVWLVEKRGMISSAAESTAS